MQNIGRNRNYSPPPLNTVLLENLHEYFEVFCFIYFLQILLKRRRRLGSRPKGTVARADASKHISLWEFNFP